MFALPARLILKSDSTLEGSHAEYNDHELSKNIGKLEAFMRSWEILYEMTEFTECAKICKILVKCM